jgi:hypothetical protein
MKSRNMKFESWMIFHAARTKLDKGFVQKLYTRTARMVEKWAANPRDCAEVSRNPIDRIRLLLEALDLAGYGDMARMAIDYMAEPLGGRFYDSEAAKSNTGDVNAEIADIAVALGELSRRIRQAKKDGRIDAAERIRIREGARSLRREIEELLDAAGIKE